MEYNTFILGAGSSYPYGYPLGEVLYEGLGNSLNGFCSIMSRLLEHRRVNVSDKLPTLPFDKWYNKRLNRDDDIENIRIIKEMSDFHSTTNYKSVDDFVNVHPQTKELVKLYVINKILYHESESFKHRNKIVDGEIQCHDDIFRRIYYDRRHDLDTAIKKNIFISFNYDRSLENSIYRFFKGYFPKYNDDALHTIFKKIKIIHVYGAVPQIYPFSLVPGCEYGNPNRYENYDDNDCSILFFHDGGVDGMIPKEITYYITNSSRIFFLGFGYIRSNMNILFRKNPDRPKYVLEGTKINGSCYKANPNRIQGFKNMVSDWYDNTYNFDPSRLLHFTAENDIDFLTNCPDFINL